MPMLPEVACVLSGVRICLGLNFPVSVDADGAQTDVLVAFQTLVGSGADAKDQPSPFISPVLLGKPLLGAVRVSAAQPALQLLADISVHPGEGVRRHHVAVVVFPAPKRLIQRLDQSRHRCAHVCTDQGSHVPDEGEDSLLGRGNMQHIGPLSVGNIFVRGSTMR